MDDIRRFIQEQMAAWDVPGCAVVAVKQGEIEMLEGFGARSIHSPEPITPDTIFGIGSTTKCFTAAAVAAMVDDGLIEWDRPLKDYLPTFRMHDPVATERLTIVDFLSHRSGLPRHEFAWLGHAERSRADIVGRLRHLPLSRDIRESWQYSNLGYIVAGHLVEAVTGTTWEEYVRMRLLKPAGMDRTNFSITETQRSDDFALPHKRTGKTLERIDFRQMDEFGPAGAMNSTARDMAQWVLVNLGKEPPVIKQDTLIRMQRSHMVIPEDKTFPEWIPYAYGLGWFVGSYRGRRVLEHGGAVDGFLTEYLLFPDEGIGVVVLTNSFSHLMQLVVAARVLDALLGEEPIDWFTRFKGRFDAVVGGLSDAREALATVEGAQLPRPLEAYAGEYANDGYGTITIGVQDEGLTFTKGTTPFTMRHRHFDVFDLEYNELTEEPLVFPLLFEGDVNGEVAALTIPFEGMVPPVRFERQPDGISRDPDTLARLVGKYAMGPIEIVVSMKAGPSLTMATPGNPGVDLVPVRGLRFKLKKAPRQTLEFVLADDGSVEKLVMQPVGVFEPVR